jgi:hypothetical protein
MVPLSQVNCEANMFKLTNGEMVLDLSETNGQRYLTKDHPEYLEWLAEGNEPLPADEPTQQE